MSEGIGVGKKMFLLIFLSTFWYFLISFISTSHTLDSGSLSVSASSTNIKKATLFFGGDVIMAVYDHESVEYVKVNVGSGLGKRYRR